jgi:hypothetical protein
MNAFRLAGAAALVLLASGCPAADSGTPAARPSGCSPAVRQDVLPEWARAGFSEPSPSGIPYVVGDQGHILGVIFGYPLSAPPPSAGPANKILWTAQPENPEREDLRIEARLEGSTEVVHREVPGGPGPSIIDMPRPGCWRLTLTWSTHTDTLDLRYETPGTPGPS